MLAYLQEVFYINWTPSCAESVRELEDVYENPQAKDPVQMEKNKESELMEVVMETKAEAGASGYSVVGGGERGIFIKEVLKDSPAAKQLSLQKGDQLLSARVYFDNVKYEDALKILQCAEPYKVSFFLKRTVFQIDDSASQGASNVELKGPTAKIQRMSVKSVKPFKVKKKRGGRFGLKRLKENKRARDTIELDIESSPATHDINPADLEFAFPKFKLSKHEKAFAEELGELEVITSGMKKRKLRFPRTKAKSAAGCAEVVSADISTPRGEKEMSGAKIKVKEKSPKFALKFPQHKKSKVPSLEDIVPLKNADAKFRPPSVEFDFIMPQSKNEVSVPNTKVDIKGKVEETKVKTPKTDLDSMDSKMKMPNIKVPKLKLSCHSNPVNGDAITKKEASEKAKLKTPTVDIAAQNIDVDVHIPMTTESPEVKDAETIDPNVKLMMFSMSEVDRSLPKLSLDAKGKAGDEKDGSMDKQTGIALPKIDISISSTEISDLSISGPSIVPKKTKKDIADVGLTTTGEKVEPPKLDVSLPKVTSPEDKVIVEGSGIKGGEFHIPSTQLSLQKEKLKGDVSVEAEVKKGGNFKLSHPDISLLKVKLPEGEMEVKGRKHQMPSFDPSLPKGQAEEVINIEGHSGKGRKIEMPKFDMSLTEKKMAESEISIEELEVKGGKIDMPDIDNILPKEKAKCSADLEVDSSKGGKFHLPDVDLSLPKMKSPDIHLNVAEPKGPKISMPSIDLSLPQGKVEGDDYIDGQSGKRKKFEMPKIDLSLPKLKSPEVDISPPKLSLPEGQINVEGPDVKSGKFSLPSFDISLPKGQAEGEIGIEGHSGKGGKIKMPKLDISLPQLKSPGGEIKVEGPEIKGGKFHMPSVDLSLPKHMTERDISLEGETKKGGEFKMPKFDISVPRMKTTGGEISIEAPDIKGGKIDIPDIDISLPKGKAKCSADFEVDGSKGGKFHLPDVDLSLPKMKSPDIHLNVAGPKGPKISMPSIDLSLPQGKVDGDVYVDGQSGKGKKFEMPKIDLSLPKLKSPEVDISPPKLSLPEGQINVEGPDVKSGKFSLPSFDISLPKGQAEGEIGIEGHSGKGGKIKMPKLDISLPQLKSPGGEIKVEGPEIKGGKFHMPSVDLSLPKHMTERDISLEGETKKGGEFKMPKFDISVPRMKTTGGEISIEAPDIKGGKIDIPDIDISLPKGKAKCSADLEVDGSKGGKFHLPDVDLSLPKMKSPDIHLNVAGPKGPKISMPSIDLSLPQGKVDGDVYVDGQSGKGKKFEMPKIDLSLPKLKSPEVDISPPKLSLPEGQINVEGPDVKSGKFSLPSFDISLPKGQAEGEIGIEGHSGKGGKIKMPKLDISLPQLKSPGGEIKVEGPEIKGGKFHMPSVDLSLPKHMTERDISLEGETKKGGEFKMPKFDISVPRMKMTGGEISIEAPDIKGGKIDIPDIDISLPKGKAKCSADLEVDGSKGGKFHLPDVDLSLPKMKSPDIHLNVAGPKGPKISMPSIDLSLPQGKVDEDVYVDGQSGKGKKFEMPKIDLSLPKLKSPEVDISPPKLSLPEGQINVEGPDVKSGKFSLPSFDISLPKGQAEGEIGIEGHSGKGGKIKMPKLDISLPQLKSPGGEIKVEGPEIKGGKFHMPSVDLSLPKHMTERDISLEGETKKGGEFKMPKFDISLPRMKTTGGEISIEAPDIKGEKIGIPDIDISLPKGIGKCSADLGVDGSKGGKFNLPMVELSLPKKKSPETEIKFEGPEIEGNIMPDATLHRSTAGNIRLPTVKLPTVDISAPKVDFGLDFGLPKGKVNDREDIKLLKAEGSRPSSGSSFEGQDLTLKMPKISLPTFGRKFKCGDKEVGFPADLDMEMQSTCLETDGDGKMKVKVKTPIMKMPSFGISKSNVDIRGTDAEAHIKMCEKNISKPEIKAEGPEDKDKYKLKLPKLKISTPRVNIPKVDAAFEVEGERSSSYKATLDTKGKVKIPLVEISLQAADTPEHEALLPKTEVDVSEADIKDYEDVCSSELNSFCTDTGVGFASHCRGEAGCAIGSHGEVVTLELAGHMTRELFISESNETTLGRRRNKEDVGAFEVKPQVIPKWRKSSKVTRPIERGLAAESKGTFDFSRLEQGWLDKRDSFPTQLVEKKEASHGTSAIAQCLKTKYRHVNRSIQPDLVNQNDLANGNESFNNDKAHLNSSELFPPPENSASAKVNASVGEQGLGHKSSNCEVHTCKERPSLCINGIDDAKHSSEHKSGLVADASLYHTAKCKGPNFVSSVPKFKEHSSGFPVLTQVTHKTYGDKELKEKLSMGYEESIVVPESRNPSDSTEAEQECNWKDRIDKVSLNSENEKPMLTIHTEFTVQDEALDRGSTIHQGMNARVRAGLGEEQWCSPACSSWHVEDVDTECETPEKRFVKSQSRISSFLKAAATSLLNPVLNTTSNGTGALATNILAASEQEEVGAIVGNIGPQPGSELLAEQEMGLDGDMVTTNEKPVVMGQEEEDDFGVFMQAGEEQIWPEGFNELQQVPCRKQDCVGYGHTTPLSDAGKAFSIVYALLGIPFTMLVLTTCVQHLIQPLTYRPMRLWQQWAGWPLRTASTVHFLILILIVMLVFFVVPAVVFSRIEESWTFLEAFYFCFISLCTIGLGDFVPGERPNQQLRPLYKVSVMVYLFVGLMVIVLVLRTFHKLADVHGWTTFFHLPTCEDEDDEAIVEALDGAQCEQETATKPLDPSSQVFYNSMSK
ncbi:hypothetical protein P4O66_018605 [Electrophorus voltai]|uniref:PDZ domain-containing protein n=1 Tax=Electrophorus voltai TaxID=2609070 RepID=A0AAD9DMI4_9TELE|nr:hypothetical protein P4O66_018605 [Electrophorus voltai]